MRSVNPALAAARALVRETHAPLLPVLADTLPVDREGAILLLEDGIPSEALLGAIAASLTQVTAAVLWAPGWDPDAAVAALARHGIEHGTVGVESAPEAGILAVLTGSESAAQEITGALSVMPRPFRVLAVLPAYNEADVIFHAVGALVAEGVDVYLIDHESTDGTAEAAAPWLGRGLVQIESFPGDARYPRHDERAMVWRDILRRVEDVASAHTADWYIFTNADEFREAPWPGVTLADGLREVDELGFNAVDFALFDFRPVDDSFVPGEDPRGRLSYYEAGGVYDSMQVKAWKRQPERVDIVTHGGHNVLFAGKRLFPVPFILRHYPIRSSVHGRRKILTERLPRFSAEERADGWHVQYDEYAAGREYLHDATTLMRWDAMGARAGLLATAARGLMLSQCVAAGERSPELSRTAVEEWLVRRSGTAAGPTMEEAYDRLLAAAQGTVLVPQAQLDAAARDLALALEAHARGRGELVEAGRLATARDALPR